MTYQGNPSRAMGTATSVRILLAVALLAHSASALSTSHLGNARSIIYTPSFRARSLTPLKMSDVPYYNQFSDEENQYYERGQSNLARLAQQAQRQQHSSTNYSYNYNNDLQSALNQELDMMEQKLLKFQESSSRRSQELLDGLEAFSRMEMFERDLWGGVDAVFASEGPFIGSFSSTDESK
jgi:hypothetical protein